MNGEEIYFEAKSVKNLNKSSQAVLYVISFFLLMDFALQNFNAVSIRSNFYLLLLGALCLYATTFRQRCWLCADGLHRERKTILSCAQEHLNWIDIYDVTFVVKKSRGAYAAVYFSTIEKTGWKLVFAKDQIMVIEDIVRQQIQDPQNINFY